MFRFIETIKVENGTWCLLDYHQARVNRTFREVLHKPLPSLQHWLEKNEPPPTGLFKCRILYDEESFKVEYEPYAMPVIRSLKIVPADCLRYEYKWADRRMIKALSLDRGHCDDALFVKAGVITDTSYANIVFGKNGKWVTPTRCLLKGTMRQWLLDQGIIIERDINVNDLPKFDVFRLVNAMMGWEGEIVEVRNIIP
jgi:4-amino-4-deoxychorismate lyase